MMSLKQSDFVAMSCIAAGVVFPFALLGAYNTVQARSAETAWAVQADPARECEAGVVDAEPTRVIVVLRRDREPITVVGDRVTITDLSREVERVQLDTRAEAGRLALLAEEVRALERRIQTERMTDRNGIEASAAERYQVVMEQLRATLEAQAPQLTVDDQHKKRRKHKRKKRRRPC